jgi:hypothetical protein
MYVPSQKIERMPRELRGVLHMALARGFYVELTLLGRSENTIYIVVPCSCGKISDGFVKMIIVALIQFDVPPFRERCSTNTIEKLNGDHVVRGLSPYRLLAHTSESCEGILEILYRIISLRSYNLTNRRACTSLAPAHFRSFC